MFTALMSGAKKKVRDDMTREEAITELNTFKICAKSEFGKNALDMAIKALKQEPILNKIRAEIEQLTITEGGDDYVRKMAELFSLKMKVLQIIDRYKAESEE